MLQEHHEREFVGNKKECPSLAPPKGIYDPAPDEMLSMQLQLAGRLSEYFPSMNYSEERDSVHTQRSVQPNEYHSCDPLSFYLKQESSNLLKGDTHLSKPEEYNQAVKNAPAGVDLSFMRRNIEGDYQREVSLDDRCLNMESNFSQASKVYQAGTNRTKQDSLVIYHLPEAFAINNPAWSTTVQASKINNLDYPDLTLQQHDCQPGYTIDSLTDFVRLQGRVPVLKACSSQEFEIHRKDSSVYKGSLDSIDCQGSPVLLKGSDSIGQSSEGVSECGWEEASKYNEDTKHNQQQEDYDQQQAFLEFLRFSNAPHGVKKYSRAARGDVRNLQEKRKFSGDDPTRLDQHDGHRPSNVAASSGADSATVSTNDISCSLSALQPHSGASNFQDDHHNMSRYRGTPVSELHDIVSKSIRNTSLSYDQDGEFKTRHHPNLTSPLTTGEELTPTLQEHSSLELECNYNTTAQQSVSSQPNSSEIVGPRVKQVFRTEKQRRDFIKERYKTLQSLVPRYSKTDRASIVGDTIHYIHVLQQQIKEMSLKREERRGAKKTERSQTAGEVSGDCSELTPRIGTFEKIFAEFCKSDERELRLTSKDGSVVRFQLITDELHVDLVQKREPYFLNRLLTSLTGFNVVNTSCGIIKNHHVLVFTFKITGNLRGMSVEIMAKIMEILDQIL